MTIESQNPLPMSHPFYAQTSITILIDLLVQKGVLDIKDVESYHRTLAEVLSKMGETFNK